MGQSNFNTAMKACCGTSTLPIWRMRFLPKLTPSPSLAREGSSIVPTLETMATITDLARHLRKDMTPSEILLWDEVRNRKLSGYKFTRQTPLFYQSSVPNKKAFFIADFYCHQKKLVIELDGRIHESQKEYDTHRDEILASIGLRTIRFNNEELTDLRRVKRAILVALNEGSE